LRRALWRELIIAMLEKYIVPKRISTGTRGEQEMIMFIPESLLTRKAMRGFSNACVLLLNAKRVNNYVIDMMI